ncbi:DUF5131 family protein [Caulobacter sp. FWC2]|uniref:DUF5131 family protein n=1 Tax=Caulobacter sp. FWC2 TaxID=69664 RepID=UPI000C15583F|nr:DUF5131 family protein [Caulobacter sp. FWC2]PIB91249.1 hypothetical protein CSW62_06465 [Caulobacter sp. FWC2]
MAENSKISWTDDTFNPWIGCTKVSPACDGCYAEALMGMPGRFGPARVQWGAPGQGEGTRDRTAPSTWAKVRKWNREQRAALASDPATPARFVFCASLADVFDNAVPTEWRRDLFALIRECESLTFLLLTKRPSMIVKLFTATLPPAYGPDDEEGEWYLPDMWPRNAAIGFTAVTQAEMDRDSRHALAAFAALRPAFLFWSGEPLLESIMVAAGLLALGDRFWAITGGETDQGKHKARDTPVGAFQAVRDQCAAARVPYQHKQNKGGATRDLDGRYHDDRPVLKGPTPTPETAGGAETPSGPAEVG